jgi:carbonic anhydrase
MDFRLHGAVREFLISLGLDKQYDQVVVAGAAKDIVTHDVAGTETILKQIKLSHELHGVNEVVLIHHMDCGAYGGSAAFDSPEAEKEKQLQDMETARQLIVQHNPEVTVKKILARIQGGDDQPEIDFEIIS